MPELPEVETIRSRLEPELLGRRLERVAIFDPRLTLPVPPELVAARLTGERVARLGRRGKYLLFGFESGATLLVHLRMTGSFRHARAGCLEQDPYRRALVRLDDRSEVAYRDVRRFGTWHVLEAAEAERYVTARLGPEPFAREFSVEALAKRLEGRTAPVKSVVLDQRTVAGVGNIYADEALWRARLHPARPAGELRAGEIRALRAGIRKALEVGIARQGATLRDYRDPDGAEGSMQAEFRVYGRRGEPCERCRTQIERITLGGRGTWLCPTCQPRWP